jgi:murein DD-endopeptidase MepM/ murein hydrolase activator NlpD
MRIILVMGVVAVLGILGYRHSAKAATTGGLTLPIAGFSVGSWFDHTSPSGYGLGDNSPSVMTRYDGTTGWSYNGHSGIDYPTGLVQGYSVVAVVDGLVTDAGWDTGGFGYRVRLWNGTHGYSPLYGHLQSSPLVSEGQSVARGQLLGYSGNTGNSTGPHLRFGVYNSQTGWVPIDPYGWSGQGNDPWTYDQGYLWSTSPPTYYLGTETAGVFRTAGDLRHWYPNDQHQGGSVTPFSYEETTDTPVTGDWDGDGDETVGTFRPSDKT